MCWALYSPFIDTALSKTDKGPTLVELTSVEETDDKAANE